MKLMILLFTVMMACNSMAQDYYLCTFEDKQKTQFELLTNADGTGLLNFLAGPEYDIVLNEKTYKWEIADENQFNLHFDELNFAGMFDNNTPFDFEVIEGFAVLPELSEYFYCQN
jgi:hypothetical protein